MISWPSSSWRKAAGSHVTSGYPFHLTRYCKPHLLSSVIQNLFNDKSFISIEVNDRCRRRNVASLHVRGKYFFSAVTLNTGWQWRVRGRSRRKAFAEILSTILKGPNDFGRSLWQGRALASGVTNSYVQLNSPSVWIKSLARLCSR